MCRSLCAVLCLLMGLTACRFPAAGGTDGTEEADLAYGAAPPAPSMAMAMAKRAAPDVGVVREAAAMTLPAADDAPTPTAPGERMVIKTASLDLEIDDYDAWMPQVRQQVESYGGYIVEASTRRARQDARRGHLSLRVPQDRFLQLLTDLQASARKVEGQQQGGDDITEEFFDVSARLENNRRTERRFREILQSAKKIEDVLAVERELARVRQTIEHLEGRQRYLKDRVDLATVRVNWHEPYPLAATPQGRGFWSIVFEGFEEGLRGFAHMLNAVIVFVIAGLPIFGFIAVVLWAAVRLVRWRQSRSLF